MKDTRGNRLIPKTGGLESGLNGLTRGEPLFNREGRSESAVRLAGFRDA